MKGLLFGVFDGLHAGHKFFISEAEARCDELTVIVAPDSAVKELKGKEPLEKLDERIRALSEWNRALDVRAGDERNGSWKVVRDERPNVIFLGYDQRDLAKEVESFGIRTVILGAHEPEKYKSSLLNGKNEGEETLDGA